MGNEPCEEVVASQQPRLRELRAKRRASLVHHVFVTAKTEHLGRCHKTRIDHTEFLACEGYRTAAPVPKVHSAPTIQSSNSF